MLRFLFMLFIGWVVWRILAPAKIPRPRIKKAPEPPRMENMLACCAHCGVYAPEREMLVDADGRHYCCAEHWKLGART